MNGAKINLFGYADLANKHPPFVMIWKKAASK
jgi:hypothetical protein